MNELEQLEEYVEQRAKQLAESYGDYPEPAKKDSILQVFREVLKLDNWKEAIKVGFLNKEELGRPTITIRHALHYGQYANTESYDRVSKYLWQHTQDVSASSLSLKAKLLEQPFTVKRETRSLGTPKETTKTGLFGNQTVVKEGMEND